MTSRNQQRLCRPDRDGIFGSEGLIFLALLLFAGFSAFGVAQTRYTANRPMSTPMPTPAAPTVADELADYTPTHTTPVHWETNYAHAVKTAKESSRCLLIYLYADNSTTIPEELAALPVITACQKFDTIILDDGAVRTALNRYVLLKLPIDAVVTSEDGTVVPISSLPGFEHIIGHPGLIAIDFENKEEPYYGELVGILPFLQGISATTEQTETFLNLPPGTLTQRTLTYAVRIHPDKPLSTEGIPAPIMLQLTTEHALYQAERNVLTHQNFGVRSGQAQEELGSGTPAEICAQSQSGLGLFEGAIACMRAWRYSSAHWSIAKRTHRYYGYDMALGKNGAWYGVGFFID